MGANIRRAQARYSVSTQLAASSSRRALHAVALAAMQLAAAQPLLVWHGTAAAQDCGAANEITPPLTTQDADEGVSPEASPSTNSLGDPDVPTAAGPGQNGSDGGQPDGGDHHDGGSAAGNPGGTDGDGRDTGNRMAGGWHYDQGGFLTGGDWLGFRPSIGGGRPTYRLPVIMDPIDVGSADKVHVQADYVSLGAAPVRLARVYHSNAAVNTARVTVPMGTGWHMFYDRSLQVLSASQIRLHRASGRTLDFSFNGSAWVSAMPAGVLTPISGGWTYVNHRDAIETYDANGRLSGMAEAGLVTPLQYDGSGRLVRIVNPFGRSLGLGYDGTGRVATVTLPDGNTLGYGYDARNNLISVRFADGAVRQYVYDNPSFPNALTGVVDESGRRRLTWGYDPAGQPNQGYYGTGAGAVSAVYNGSQVTTTDARGTQRIRNFGNVAGRRVVTSIQTAATTDSAATGWSFMYDANGNPLSVTTRSGEIQQVTTDSRGRETALTRAAGTAQALAAQTIWHPTFRKPTQAVSAGVTDNYAIDSAGRLTQVTSNAGNTSAVVYSAVYNAQNLLQSTTDVRGATTSFTYDSAGNLATMTNNALVQTTYFQNYNAHGQPTRIQRPDGTIVTRSFDTRGRMLTRTDPSGTAQYAYDAAGRVTSVTAPDGGWKSYGYDAAGLLSSIANNRGETTSITRDATGAETNRSTYSATGALAAQAKRQLDAVGRVAAVIDSRGYRAQLLYGIDGRPNGMSDPLNRTKSLQLDVLNRVTTVTQPNTAAMILAGGPATTSSRQAFDVNNNHQSTVDTNAVATGYAYDSFNRRSGESGADPGSIGLVRNNAGDVTSYTDALNVTYTGTYDAVGRISTIKYAGASTPIVTYNYVTGRSDKLLASMVDRSGSTAWTYDSAGRLLTKQQTTNGVSRSTSISRDTIGRPSSITYPSGMRLDIVYSADTVSSLSLNGATLLSNITYRPFSQAATGWRWGNGSSYSRSFDADGRVTSVSLGSVQRSFGYDASGQITSQTDVGPQGTRTASYGYDEAGQLISNIGGLYGNTSYTYDTNGNRRTSVLNGSTQTYGYAANSNRMTSDGQNGTNTYNADGSASNYHGFALVYGDFGRLVRATSTDPSGPVIQFFHNGLGQRVLKTSRFWTNAGAPLAVSPRTLSTAKTQQTAAATQASSGFWTTTKTDRFFYDDQGHLLGEYDSTSGYSQETVWFNGQPVATVTGGKTYYVFADQLGSPRSLVRASDNVEVWRWESDPFGNGVPNSLVTYNLRFPGQYADVDMGLNYNGMRDYDPWAGRYIEADPIGLLGGLSRYTYVGGNPLSFVDPTGLLFGATLGGVQRGTTFDQAVSFGAPGNAAIVIAGGTLAAGTAVGTAWWFAPPAVSGGGLPGFLGRMLLRGLQDEALPPPTPPVISSPPPPAIIAPGPPPPAPLPPLMCKP